MTAIEGHCLVWFRSSLYVFGGKNGRGEFMNDLWEVSLGASGGTMSRLETTGERPPPRAYQACTLWRERYLIVMGGVGNAPHYDPAKVYVLDIEQKVWRERTAGGDVPAARSHHTLSLSPRQDRLWLYGGYPAGAENMFAAGSNTETVRTFYEVYELNLTGSELVWRRLPCREEFPPALWGHTATLYNSNVILFGGVDVVDSKESALACVWQCDKEQWRWVEFNHVPQARALHSSVDVRDGRLCVFGGFGNSNAVKYSDTWMFSMEAGQWAELQTRGDHPSPRSGHAAALVQNQMFVLGGVDSMQRVLPDLYVLHIPSASWSRVPLQLVGRHIPSPERLESSLQPSQHISRMDKADSLITRAEGQLGSYERMRRQHFPDPDSGNGRLSPVRRVPDVSDPVYNNGHPAHPALSHPPPPAPPSPPPPNAAPELLFSLPPPGDVSPSITGAVHAPGPPVRGGSVLETVPVTPPLPVAPVGPVGPVAPVGNHRASSLPQPHPLSSKDHLVPYADPVPVPAPRGVSPSRQELSRAGVAAGMSVGVSVPPVNRVSFNTTSTAHVPPPLSQQPQQPQQAPQQPAVPKFSQSVQTEEQAAAPPPPPPPAPAPALAARPEQQQQQQQTHAAQGAKDDRLQQEAAEIIQKQRLEIDMLRAMLERGGAGGSQGPLANPMQGPLAPPAPRIPLTKDTIADMMPKLNYSLVDTPVLSLPPKPEEGAGGLMSQRALQDLIERRLAGPEKRHPPHGASPILNPSLLPTAPTDSSRFSTQRRDIGKPGQAAAAGHQLSPPRSARPGDVSDIIQYDPLDLFGTTTGGSRRRAAAVPSHHPSVYKPPASYSELLARGKSADQQPVPAPPPASSTPLPVGDRQHKSPSLAKILRGDASMLSITHVQDPSATRAVPVAP